MIWKLGNTDHVACRCEVCERTGNDVRSKFGVHITILGRGGGGGGGERERETERDRERERERERE